MSGNEKGNSILGQIIVAVVIAILVGRNAPWWWQEFFGDKDKGSSPTPSSISKLEWYSKLENYLAKQEWKQADLETSSLIFKGSNSNTSNVSCAEINKIDELWLKYSDGRFGFSVQSSIYQKTKNPLRKHQQDTWRKFADRVGWRVNGIWLESYDRLNLSLNAPEGHLPVFAGKSSGMRNINAISRAIECGIGGKY